MNTAAMTERIAETSPRFQARIAGLIALMTTTAGFALFACGVLQPRGMRCWAVHSLFHLAALVVLEGAQSLSACHPVGRAAHRLTPWQRSRLSR